MAQKAKKDRAKANTTALNRLHIGTVAVHAFFLMTHVLFRRSLVVYSLLSAPSIVCEFILETTGRPKYDSETGALTKSGDDLAQQGLIEYMFDVVWVTWTCILTVCIFGNWGWVLWVSIPAYGLYLGSGLWGMGRSLMAGNAQAQPGEEVAPQGNRKQRRAA